MKCAIMHKILIFLALLVGSSFFLMNVSALEVEIDKESERIIESMGWLRPDKISYQEQIQIVIDHDEKKNRISVGMLSTDPNNIRFPDYIESIVDDPKIISFILTNQFACSPNNIDKACVILDVNKDGLGDTIPEIRENTRKITDRIVGDGVILYMPEFDSVSLVKKTDPNGKQLLVSRALYTINKQPTHDLFLALSSMLLSGEIRSAGGFYTVAEEISKNSFSSFSIALTPQDDSILRSLQITLACSDTLIELVDCPRNVSEQIERGDVSPLDFIEVENLNRSSIFENEFLPLNSIIHVLIFSAEDLQVKSVNSSIIEKLNHISDVQESGWFFVSNSTPKIDVRFIFGAESTIDKNSAVFSIGSNSGDVVKVNDGGCLIATAAFGSELAPQVQLLREIRDKTVLQTESGALFMTGFNHFYYLFSPVVADYERENPIFKESVKITLMPLLASLTLLQYADIDSESEMLGYGIGIMLLNIGMYFVIPAIFVMKIRKLI